MVPGYLTQFAAAPLAACPMVIGGIACTASDAAFSLSVLIAAPGLMIRQPLLRAGSPLAACDYHRVAAPYRDRFTVVSPGEHLHRGAAGRHIAKQAFCAALGALLASVADDPWAAWEALAARAWRAFASDPGYATQIAAAASSTLRLPALPGGLPGAAVLAG